MLPLYEIGIETTFGASSLYKRSCVALNPLFLFTLICAHQAYLLPQGTSRQDDAAELRQVRCQ